MLWSSCLQWRAEKLWSWKWQTSVYLHFLHCREIPIPVTPAKSWLSHCCLCYPNYKICFSWVLIFPFFTGFIVDTFRKSPHIIFGVKPSFMSQLPSIMKFYWFYQAKFNFSSISYLRWTSNLWILKTFRNRFRAKGKITSSFVPLTALETNKNLLAEYIRMDRHLFQGKWNLLRCLRVSKSVRFTQLTISHYKFAW